MGKPLWTNARDNPNFSPYKYMIAVSTPFILIFSSAIVTVREQSLVSLLGLQSIYMALCIFVGAFLLHSGIINPREFLIVWKNKVFVQIPGFNSGWRTIPRNRFKVDVFRYKAREDLGAPAEPPEITLWKTSILVSSRS